MKQRSFAMFIIPLDIKFEINSRNSYRNCVIKLSTALLCIYSKIIRNNPHHLRCLREKRHDACVVSKIRKNDPQTARNLEIRCNATTSLCAISCNFARNKKFVGTGAALQSVQIRRNSRETYASLQQPLLFSRFSATRALIPTLYNISQRGSNCPAKCIRSRRCVSFEAGGSSACFRPFRRSLARELKSTWINQPRLRRQWSAGKPGLNSRASDSIGAVISAPLHPSWPSRLPFRFCSSGKIYWLYNLVLWIF